MINKELWEEIRKESLEYEGLPQDQRRGEVPEHWAQMAREFRSGTFYSYKWKFQDREYLGYYPWPQGQATLDLLQTLGESVEFARSFPEGWKECTVVYRSGSIVEYTAIEFEPRMSWAIYNFSADLPDNVNPPPVLNAKRIEVENSQA